MWVIGLVILIIVLLVVKVSITGNIISTSTLKCYDSDGGNKIYSAGYAYMSSPTAYGIPYKDACMTQTSIKEYYCSLTGQITYKTQTCSKCALNSQGMAYCLANTQTCSTGY